MTSCDHQKRNKLLNFPQCKRFLIFIGFSRSLTMTERSDLVLQRHINFSCLCHTFVASPVTLNKSAFSNCVSSVSATERLMEAVWIISWSFCGSWYPWSRIFRRQIRMILPKSERRRQAIKGITTIQLRPVTKKNDASTLGWGNERWTSFQIDSVNCGLAIARFSLGRNNALNLMLIYNYLEQRWRNTEPLSPTLRKIITR